MNLAPMLLPFVVGLAPLPQSEVPSRFVGTWTLESSREGRAVVRQAGLAPETIIVRLNADGTFRYTVQTGTRVRSTSGTFDVTGNDLSLLAERPFPGVGGRRLVGRLWDEGLELLGAPYGRENSRPLPPEDITYGRPDPELPRPRVAAPIPEPAPLPARRWMESIVGNWTLRSNGREDRSNRFRFTENGRFEFQGGNASSAGRYTFVDGMLTLNYETVDGEPVKWNMKRTFHINAEHEFVIDRYHYERQK